MRAPWSLAITKSIFLCSVKEEKPVRAQNSSNLPVFALTPHSRKQTSKMLGLCSERNISIQNYLNMEHSWGLPWQKETIRHSQQFKYVSLLLFRVIWEILSLLNMDISVVEGEKYNSVFCFTREEVETQRGWLACLKSTQLEGAATALRLKCLSLLWSMAMENSEQLTLQKMLGEMLTWERERGCGGWGRTVEMGFSWYLYPGTEYSWARIVHCPQAGSWGWTCYLWNQNIGCSEYNDKSRNNNN